MFSVNQYSQDLLESWAGKIESIVAGENKTEKVNEFLSNNNSIGTFYIIDTKALKYITSYHQDNFRKNLSLLDTLLASHNDVVERLLNYKKSGYRKIEPVYADSTMAILIFAFQTADLSDRMCAIAIDPVRFIQTRLEPRFKIITGSEFVITVISPDQKYFTDGIKSDANDQIQVKKAVWLLPGYELGIALKGETIDSLVKQRAFINFLLIIILILVLLVGIYIVFRNVKKEIEIAQMKSDFVSNVSHELRTPLSMISMFSETLEMGRVATEEKRQEYYKIISQETSRLSRIVNSILNFSKMEAGKRKYNFVDSFLNDIVETVHSSYKTHLNQNGFKTEFIKDENIPVQRLDEEAVSEAVMNLLDNAIKYSKDKKNIIIKTGLKKHYSFVEIKDSGIGISKENEAKIFEKFYRVSTGSVHNVKGTGLGLSIVKHIVESHGGTIELESLQGKGSTFRLNFPLKN